MKVIYFYDSKQTKLFLALGQIVTLLQACYFRGKELGYEKIVFEWHNLVTYPGWSNENTFKGIINSPKNSILPITIIEKGSRIPSNYHKIDLSEPNSLYDGCPPIMQSNGYKMKPTHDFLNRYYINHNSRPILSLARDKEDKYILFHYRESTQDRQIKRNTPYEEWNKIFELIKYSYGNEYKLKKIGEPSKIDDRFDEVFDYFPNNIEKLFEIINNASLYVGGASGPITITFLLGVPGILLLKQELDPIYIGKNSPHEWVDPLNYLCLFNSDKDKVFNFLERINL